MNEFASLPGFVSSQKIDESLAADGISVPTGAQSASFEAILAGKNVVLDSGTGTGKTLAYLLPLLQRLREKPEQRLVCLAPAPELAVQTLRVASRYIADDIRSGALVGGGNQKKQKDRVQKSTRLVCGTPGRVLEMVSAKKLKGVSTYVLDEPEPILNSRDAGFLVEVLSRPPRPQIVVVGATFGRVSNEFISEMLGDDAVRIQTEENPLLDKITHQCLFVQDARQRDLQMLRFLQQEKEGRVMVYVNQSHLIKHLYRHLIDGGVKVATLSHDRTKEQCKQALRQFSTDQAQVLLTTDRAATGIDVSAVTAVLHYELPRSTQAYVHRAGRTARAGNTGRSVVLFSDQEHRALKRLEKDLEVAFKSIRV